MDQINKTDTTVGRKRILLVEDEVLIAMAEAETLERLGYTVETAASGDRAIAEATTHDYDLILMDIDLGVGRTSGTEAAQKILADREIPIVFLTSHMEEEVVAQVRGITGYGYVLKSSGDFVLAQSIETAFELFAAKRMLQIENDNRREAEARLKERNTFIETILDNLPIGLAVNAIDDGTASYINEQFETIYGWPREKMVDIPTFFKRVYPDEKYRTELFDRIMSDIASGDPARMRWNGVRITRESGETAMVDAINIPIYDQGFMISTVIDVTEHYITLKALAESEARYRAVTQKLPNGLIALFDRELRFVTAGGSALETGPLTEEMLVGHQLREIYPAEIADRDEPSLRAALAGDTIDQVVEHDGHYYRVITAPIRDGREIKHGLVLTQDITATKVAEREYERVLEQLDLAIETAELGLWKVNAETGDLDWNSRLLEIFGVSREDFDGAFDTLREMVHPDDVENMDREIRAIRDGRRVKSFVFRIVRPDGAVRHISASGTPIDREGSSQTYLGFAVDITESVERERQLAEALNRLEAAIRESNHRIKNNLLAVKSLVDLGDRAGRGTESIKEQINSIIAVHDLLGQTDHVGRVGVQSLLDKTSQPHLTSIAKSGGTLEVKSIEIEVDSKTAIPIALIVNELITNAIRHGVRPRANDFVHVSLSAADDGVIIVVENSGNPLPAGFPDTRSDSLGWTLVRALAEQVDATITVGRAPHTTIAVAIPARSLQAS